MLLTCNGRAKLDVCPVPCKGLSKRNPPNHCCHMFMVSGFQLFQGQILAATQQTLTTLTKLSSSSTTSDAVLAISVPVYMAKPTSASFNAGASLVPSPVTATVFPAFLSISTKMYLS